MKSLSIIMVKIINFLFFASLIFCYYMYDAYILDIDA